MTTRSLSGKIPFEGPKGTLHICRKIILDAKAEGMELSYYVIIGVIGLFFKHLTAHVKKGHMVRVDELGDFGMNPVEQEKRMKRDAYLAALDKEFKREVNRRNCYRKRARRRWRRDNEKMVAHNIRPVSFRDWKTIHKVKLPQRRKSFSKYKKFHNL